MRVCVSLEQRFLRLPDGSVWTTSAFPYSFWTRYLSAFDGVKVLARTMPIDQLPADAQRVDGPSVQVMQLPYYVGLKQYLSSRGQVRQAIKDSVEPQDAIVLRLHSAIGNVVWDSFLRNGRPYGTELVTDPWDNFAPGSVKHPLRPLLRLMFYRAVKKQVRNAHVAAYVTRAALQARYPHSEKVKSFHYSSVQLEDSSIALNSRVFSPSQQDFTIVHVAMLNQPYKGTDTLLHALKLLSNAKIRVNLRIVGGGRLESQLRTLAENLGVADQVDFVGVLSNPSLIQAELDKSDLFVLPSRQEGLPRAMIEAMSRGLPCVGSSVGGIPELLDAEDIEPSHDPVRLSNKILEVLTSTDRLNAMSRRNLERSKDYADSILQARRRACYHEIRDRTEEWIRSNSTKSSSS